MLPGLLSFGAGGAGAVATVTFEQAYTDGTGTVHTITAADLGAAGTKKVIICVNSQDGTAHTLTVTVDGQLATQVVEATSTTSNYKSQIWEINTVTAATGDIVVTSSISISAVIISVYAALDAAATVHDTGTSIADPGNTTIDCPKGGFIIGCAEALGASDISWTNLTEDNESTPSTWHSSVASDEFATAQTVRSITATYTGTTTRQAMVLASWGPA